MYNKKLYLLTICFIKCYLFSSQKPEVLHLKIQITDLTNQNTCIRDMTVKSSIFYTDSSKDYVCFNQSHVSIFNFNKQEPLEMTKGYFLDFKEKNFFPEKAFVSENMAKLKLYLFPFDSNNQTTVLISDIKIECTLMNDNILKVKRTINNTETIYEKNEFFDTSNGYFGWTKTCLTICDIDDCKKAGLTIDNTNGYVLDQAKDFFLNDHVMITHAYSCCYGDCTQKELAHFHNNFPSLLVIPFNKDGKASFTDHSNQKISLEIIKPLDKKTDKISSSTKVYNESETNPNKESQNPVSNRNPFHFSTELPDNDRIHAKSSTQFNKKNLPEKEKNKKETKQSNFSFFLPLKIASFALLTLFVITQIIKGYSFFHFK